MSSSYYPTIDEMRIELQVLTRAVSILFTTHPDPTALRAEWDTVTQNLKPQAIEQNASEIEKKLHDTRSAEFRLAAQLQGRIG